jgi:hypothetical protein
VLSALGVPAYRSAACIAGAVRDGGVDGAFNDGGGGAGWPDALRAFAATG